MNEFLNIVRAASKSIHNGRTKRNIYDHLISEAYELNYELGLENHDLEPGEDGIFGESIDVIACALDMIFVDNPDVTDQEIIDYLRKKVQKWKDKNEY